MNSGYRLSLEKEARRFLKKQDKNTQKRIIAATEKLLMNPPEGDIKMMKERAGIFRLRVGTYRILFRVDHENEVVLIEMIGNRGDIYKK